MGSLLTKLASLRSGAAGPHAAAKKRVLRRQRTIQLFLRHGTRWSWLLYVIAILYLFYLPTPSFLRSTFTDENALLAGQVNRPLGLEHNAVVDEYATSLKTATPGTILSVVSAACASMDSAIGVGWVKTNRSSSVYAVAPAKRGDGTESLVLSVPVTLEDGRRNVHGIAAGLTILAASKDLGIWAKDLVLSVHEGRQAGADDFVAFYQGKCSSGVAYSRAEHMLKSTVIQAAVNLEVLVEPGQLNALRLLYTGRDGQLPNMDLIASVVRICKFEWVPLYLKSFWPVEPIGDYYDYAQTMFQQAVDQAFSIGDASHAVFHSLPAPAITIQGIDHENERVVASTLKAMNNLLERLHASFFFYLMASPDHFLSLTHFVLSLVLILVALFIPALHLWWTSGNAIEDAEVVEQEDGTLAVASSTAKYPADYGKAAVIVVGSFAMVYLPHYYALSHTQLLMLSPLLFILAPVMTSMWLTTDSSAHQGSLLRSVLSLYFALAALVILTLGMLNFPLGLYHGVVLFPALMTITKRTLDGYEPSS